MFPTSKEKSKQNLWAKVNKKQISKFLWSIEIPVVSLREFQEQGGIDKVQIIAIKLQCAFIPHRISC